MRKDESFPKLLRTTDEKVLCNGEVVRMNQVLICYKLILQEANLELGVVDLMNLRARIERHYGQEVEFYKVPEKHTVFVCISKLCGGQLYNTSSFDNVLRCAKLIREEIKGMQNSFEN